MSLANSQRALVFTGGEPTEILKGLPGLDLQVTVCASLEELFGLDIHDFTLLIFTQTVLTADLIERLRASGRTPAGQALILLVSPETDIGAFVGRKDLAFANFILFDASASSRALHLMLRAVLTCCRTVGEFSEKLELAEQRRSEFMAQVCHEVRSPLTAILGYSELLLESGHSAMQSHRYSEAIFRNGQKIAGVLDDVIASFQTDTP